MATVIPPRERTCERCGRHDEWDDEARTWLIVSEGGDKQVGNPHCLHEWDINGAYNPFEN